MRVYSASLTDSYSAAVRGACFVFDFAPRRIVPHWRVHRIAARRCYTCIAVGLVAVCCSRCDVAYEHNIFYVRSAVQKADIEVHLKRKAECRVRRYGWQVLRGWFISGDYPVFDFGVQVGCRVVVGENVPACAGA